jgi:hypothetical protein
MNDIYIDRLKMATDTLAYLKVPENAAIIAANTYITAAILHVDNAIQRIELLSLVQSQDHTGLTVAKNRIEGELVTVSTKVVDGLVSFATATDNDDLLSNINFKPSDFLRARDFDLTNIAKTIAEKAGENKTALRLFGVNEEDITAVSNKLGQYEIAIPAKRLTDADKKAATQQIDTEFQNLGTYMRTKLDNLLKQYRTSHPDFYKAYINVRIIVNRGTRSATSTTTTSSKEATIGGIVKHFETGLPEPEVTVKLLPTALTVVTGTDGLFNFTVTQSGLYTPLAQKTNFTLTDEEPIDVILGKTYYFEIILEPTSEPSE